MIANVMMFVRSVPSLNIMTVPCVRQRPMVSAGGSSVLFLGKPNLSSSSSTVSSPLTQAEVKTIKGRKNKTINLVW